MGVCVCVHLLFPKKGSSAFFSARLVLCGSVEPATAERKKQKERHQADLKKKIERRQGRGEGRQRYCSCVESSLCFLVLARFSAAGVQLQRAHTLRENYAALLKNKLSPLCSVE
jgi:hypothetical protein